MTSLGATVLEAPAGNWLTKTVRLASDGRLDVVAFKAGPRFRMEPVEMSGIDNLRETLASMAQMRGRCLVRGLLASHVRHGELLYRRFRHADHYTNALEECPRAWMALDLDGVPVPHGLGAPDRLVEAASYIRDNLLPPEFRDH